MMRPATLSAIASRRAAPAGTMSPYARKNTCHALAFAVVAPTVPSRNMALMGYPLVVSLALALALGTFARLCALDVSLSQQDIERALASARGSEAERARFHSRYRFPLNDATVPQVEVITDRKSTRLNSSHDQISYAVFCLQKKNQD